MEKGRPNMGVAKCGITNCGMQNKDLKERTKRFALEIIGLVDNLSKNPVTNIIGKQILKSGTSVGANYRAACKARSRADFISKMGIVGEETDETLYGWNYCLIQKW